MVFAFQNQLYRSRSISFRTSGRSHSRIGQTERPFLPVGFLLRYIDLHRFKSEPYLIEAGVIFQHAKMRMVLSGTLGIPEYFSSKFPETNITRPKTSP